MFTVEKLDLYHLNEVITVNMTSNGTKQNHVSADRMQGDNVHSLSLLLKTIT